MGLPLLTIGQVISQDPDGGGVTIILRTSGSAPGYPVRMLYNGPADSLRIEQKPLPGRGTWGVVMFPYNDPRNGIWLGSFFPSQIDAIASITSGTGPTNATESNIDYQAHFSGYWHLLDPLGQESTVFPDGSFMYAGSDTEPPTVYRHTLDQQSRVRSEFTQDQRVPDPPDPFNFVLQTSGVVSSYAYDVSTSGVSSISYSSSGIALSTDDGTDNSSISIAVSGVDVESTSGDLKFNTSSGDVTVNSDSGTVTISAGSSTIIIDNSGDVIITTAGAVKIGGDGAILGLAIADAVSLAYNGHIHTTSSGPTGGPIPAMDAIASQVALVTE